MTIMEFITGLTHRRRPSEPAGAGEESHSDRLERLARAADEAEGPDLGAMSREERRKALFGG